MTDVFEYANHTDSFHRRSDEATSIIMSASDGEFFDDLNTCNEKDIIGTKDVFAYPFGLYNGRNVSLLREKGYSLAFTSEDGLNDEKTDPLLLKRNAIPYFIDMEAFRQIIGESDVPIYPRS